jgi:hypothetical protein
MNPYNSFVYICRQGDNEELRYSIRSVLNSFPDASICLIGGKPEWYCGDYVPVEDTGNKFDNITNCYKTIVESDQIDEDFVLMNDDFYVLKKIDSIPLFYDGTLSNKIDSHMLKYGMSAYARVLVKAKKDLIKAGISDPLCYDVHMPMIFNKTMLSYLDHTNNAPRSTYGNMYNLGGIDVKDVKIYHNSQDKDVSNLSFLSTEDDSFKFVSDQLIRMFPHKTIIER